METKECRHCRQPIHKDARRCQHCQGMQTWISDQKDPRMWVVIFVPLLLILVGTFWMSRAITKPLERSEIEKASLSISNVSYRFGSDSKSDRVFVYGEVSNASAVEAGQTCLRVNLFGRDNKIIDSFVQSMDSSWISAHETKRFRIMADTPARQDEIKKAEVVVERVRAKGRWD